MFSVFLSACVLSLLTVYTHASGIALLMRRLERSRSTATSQWFIRRTLLRIIWWLVVLHLAEISIWALFYQWRGFFPDAESAFYFSASTYTTLGYGDVVLPREWRMLAPVEALTAILMCGLSTGLFFALVTVWVRNWMQRRNAADVSIPTSD